MLKMELIDPVLQVEVRGLFVIRTAPFQQSYQAKPIDRLYR